MSLAQRAVKSSTYNLASQAVQVVVLLVRSVLLARILGPETFGIYAFAQGIIAITRTFPNFGFGNAFVHRSPESEHPDAPRVYLLLLIVTHLIWATLLVAGSLFFLSGPRQVTLWILIGLVLLSQFITPQLSMLKKRVQLQRLAVIDLVTAIITTFVSIVLAINGAGIFALLSIDFIDLIILLIGILIISPVWKPGIAWKPDIARYFLKFGSKVTLASILVAALDRIDDLWTGTYLGDKALGLYSRAYTFATYPRRIFSSPLENVAMGSYAEVKQDRKTLSQVFFRFTAVTVRMSMLFSGVLFLIAPEFVNIFLGEEWTPMISVFQWMIFYTMIDPIRYMLGNLFVSIGHPEELIRVRSIQLIVLVAGLFVLGNLFGITGVAIAATIMVITGMLLLIWKSKIFVDYSVLKMFTAPGLAVGLGFLVNLGIIPIVINNQTVIWQMVVKAFIFTSIYLLVLLIAERHYFFSMLDLLKKAFSRQEATKEFPGATE